jgi:hypothetical protein
MSYLITSVFKLPIKFFILVLLLFLMSASSGCSKQPDDVDQGFLDDSGTTQASDTDSINGFRMLKGQTAVSDDSGNVYFIGNTGVHRIDANTGQIETLVDDFSYGYFIGLHNDYVYYVNNGILCRIKTDGSEKFEYPSQFERGIGLMYVHDDILYVMGVNEDSTFESYFTDISGDPDALVFSEGTNGFDPTAFRYSRDDYLTTTLSAKAPDLEVERQAVSLEKSDDYLYFYWDDEYFGRIDLKTEEVQVLQISPLEFRTVTVVDNWIYYNGQDGIMWRTAEDLSSTEKLR